METGILPTVSFLSLQFVISWSLLSSFWTDISSSHASTKTPLFIPESPVHETQQAEQPLAVARRWFQLLDPSLKNKRVWVTHKQHLQTQCTWKKGVNRKDFQGWPDSTVRLHPQPTFKTCSRQCRDTKQLGEQEVLLKTPERGLAPLKSHPDSHPWNSSSEFSSPSKVALKAAALAENRTKLCL